VLGLDRESQQARAVWRRAQLPDRHGDTAAWPLARLEFFFNEQEIFEENGEFMLTCSFEIQFCDVTQERL
jgi:hypothetical protein